MIMSTWIVSQNGQTLGSVEARDIREATLLAGAVFGLLRKDDVRTVRAAVSIELDGPSQGHVPPRPLAVAREWAQEGRQFTADDLTTYCGCQWEDSHAALHSLKRIGVLSVVEKVKRDRWRVTIYGPGPRAFDAREYRPRLKSDRRAAA